LSADAVGKRFGTVYGETEKEALANAQKEFARTEVEKKRIYLRSQWSMELTGMDRKAVDAALQRAAERVRREGAGGGRMTDAPDIHAVCPANVREAWAALCMIREALEQHCPPGTVPNSEHVEPTFMTEAQALAKAIDELATSLSGGRLHQEAVSPTNASKPATTDASQLGHMGMGVPSSVISHPEAARTSCRIERIAKMTATIRE
jgi:hypothetical protein